jgi:hypothetical protein
VAVICPTAQAKYFCAKGWTGFHARPLICPTGKSAAQSARDVQVLKIVSGESGEQIVFV